MVDRAMLLALVLAAAAAAALAEPFDDFSVPEVIGVEWPACEDILDIEGRRV